MCHSFSVFDSMYFAKDSLHAVSGVGDTRSFVLIIFACGKGGGAGNFECSNSIVRSM